MAELPSNSGRSQPGAVAEGLPDASAVPVWMAARRSRVPAAPASDELEVEFATVPEDEHSEAAEPSAPVELESKIPSPAPASAPVVLNLSPVNQKARPKRIAILTQITGIDPSAPLDKSFKASLLRWIRSATMAGVLVSLVIHSGLLSVMAVLVFNSTTAKEEPLDVFGVIGDPNGDQFADIELDSDMMGGVHDPGHDAAPLEYPDVAAMMNNGSAFVNPGEALRGLAGGTGDGSGDGMGGGSGSGVALPAVNVPKYAVTKGSFSVWTDPKDPVPGISYEIVIQFRLPANVKRYKGSDLSGMVVGTDDYKQAIRLGSKTFPVEDGSVQVRVRVPGANQLVRDTIRVESKLLREKQVIEIVF